MELSSACTAAFRGVGIPCLAPIRTTAPVMTSASIRRPARASTSTGLTVAGLAERFMRVHVEAHLKPGSVAAYRSVLEKHVLPALGAMTVGQVGRAEISALHHRLRDTPSRANMAVHPLSRMFTLAEAWDLAPAGRNPCRGLRRYRTRPRERFLTPVEYRRLCREVLNQPDRRAALRFLGQALPSLETDVPGLNNEGLAALHELLHCGETKIIANGPKINKNNSEFFQAICNYFFTGYSGEARIPADS